MKKILFVAATLGGGGAERVMLNLANAISAKGNDVVILQTAADKNPDMMYSVEESIRIEKIECRYKKKLFRNIYKLGKTRSFLKKYKGYTVVSFLPDVSMYCIVANIGVGNKIVLSERNDPNREPGSRLLRKIRDFIYRFSDFVVFQTKDAQDYFCDTVKVKSAIIPNPLVNEKIPFLKFDSKRRKVIIMVCRVKPQKNVGMMIEAINSIKDKMDGYTVEIYGDGNLHRDMLKQRIVELGLEDIISFMGPSNKIYEVMQEASIFVSTSDYEGISNTMLEALAIGLPSIVTDCPIGGAKMFIENNTNGILVPVGNSCCLAKELLRLMQDTELQRKLSENAIAIRKQLDIETICNKWLAIL